MGRHERERRRAAARLRFCTAVAATEARLAGVRTKLTGATLLAFAAGLLVAGPGTRARLLRGVSSWVATRAGLRLS